MADRVILLRHGVTEWNATGRWQGRTDVSLSDAGRAQAEVSADLLDTWYEDVSMVVSSPLERACHTAGAVVDAFASKHRRELTLHTEPDFQEFDSGGFEGLYRDEILAKYGENLAAFKRGEDVQIGETGERSSEVAARVVAGFERWVDKAPDGTLVLVGHGGAWRILAYALMGLSHGGSGLWVLANCHWGLLRPGQGAAWDVHAWNVGPRMATL